MKFRLSGKRLAVAVLAGVLALPPAGAGDFTVTPVRMSFGLRDRAIAVTVTNNDSVPLTMQADLYQWSQNAEGQDVLTPTEDLFLSPPILTIPAKSRQIVRLARFRDGPPAEGEPTTYRMIVREIPEAVASSGVAVRIALAFSLPVFILPEKPQRQLECGVRRTAPDAVRATCTNTGNVHALIPQMVLSPPGGTPWVDQEIGGGYILPGATRGFDLRSTAGAIPAGPARLVLTLEDLSHSSHDVQVGE